MFAALELKVKAAARRLVLVLVGVAALVVGLGFFTYVGWTWLAEVHGPLMAGTMFGAGFSVVGLIFLLASRTRGRRAQAATANSSALTQAFLVGMAAGTRAGRG